MATGKTTKPASFRSERRTILKSQAEIAEYLEAMLSDGDASAAEPAHPFRWVRKDGGSDGRCVGFYFRNVTELVLFGVRGKNARTLVPARRQVNMIQSPKREHSRKPDELYDVIERCSAGPYLEALRTRAAREMDRFRQRSERAVRAVVADLCESFASGAGRYRVERRTRATRGAAKRGRLTRPQAVLADGERAGYWAGWLCSTM